MWDRLTIWTFYISTITWLMISKSGRLLTYGRRLSTQTLKSTSTSCFSFSICFSSPFLDGLAKVLSVIFVSCSSRYVWPRSRKLHCTHRLIIISTPWNFICVSMSKNMKCTMAENWHMISFSNFTFFLYFLLLFLFHFSLFCFVHFIFVLILFPCCFYLVHFHFLFFPKVLFPFHVAFWNETKWKPRGQELTYRQK